MFNPDGTFVDNWWRHAGRPDLDSSARTLSRYKTPDSLADVVEEIQKIRSGPPPPDAAPDTVAAFKHWIGVPDRYEVKAPEGRELDPALVGRFTAIADKHHGRMTNEAFNDFAAEFIALQDEAAVAWKNQAEQAREEALKALETSHGRDFPIKLENAQKAAIRLGLDPADPDIGNNPKVIDALIRISDMIGGASLHGATAPAGDFRGSGAEAEDIMSNSANPWHEAFHDPTHPRFSEAQAVYNRALQSHLLAIGRG